MRICYLAPRMSIPNGHGGATHVYEVSYNLAKLGVEVHTITKRKVGQKRIEKIDENFYVHRINIPNIFFRRTVDPFTAIFKTFSYTYKLTKKIEFDLFYERLHFTSLTGSLLKISQKKPLVLEVNSPYVTEAEFRGELPSFVGKFFRILEDFQFKTADMIVVPLKTLVTKGYHEKIELTEWGANIKKFNPKISGKDIKKRFKNKRIVCFSGAMSYWHGIKELVGAAKILDQKRDDIIFLMIGSGPLYKKFKEKTKKLKNLRWVGKIKYEDMPKYLAACDICIAPFNDKYYSPIKKFGFYWSPLKLFEYMAMKKPIITTKLANRLIKNNKTGIVIKPSSKELSEKIEKLLRNRKLMIKLGSNAREEVVKKYSWETHCKNLKKVFKEVVDKNV